MKNKLAGRLTLQEAIEATLAETKAKLAAVKGEEKDKVKKLVSYEKKEHGHTPTAAEEKEECKDKESSALPIDPTDPEEVEKLAAALDQASDLLAKEADVVEHGGESRQGGVVLPTARPVGGTQPYKKDSSKAHSVPMSTGMEKAPDASSATSVPTNLSTPPAGGKGYPAKGVLKKAEAETAKRSSVEVMESVIAKAAAEKATEAVPEKKDPAKDKPEDEKKVEEKKAGAETTEQTAVEYILGKLSSVETGGESKQGGEVPANHAPVPSNPGRQLIGSNAAAQKAKKVQAKAPRKAELAQVLTEPAMSKAHDSKVHENLRNATKGGVKIAAAKALLAKIAEEGCQCGGDTTCRYCKMKKAMAEKKAEVKTEKKDETAPPAK